MKLNPERRAKLEALVGLLQDEAVEEARKRLVQEAWAAYRKLRELLGVIAPMGPEP